MKRERNDGIDNKNHKKILRDMKLSQIADYTGKSEANISVVRSRIRKKQNLNPGDDLRTALLKKMKEK